MLKYHTDDIRTIALVGHRASGKTSLADALLYKAKAVDRLGSVDDGTSISDYDDEEHKHHFSIDTSVLHLEHGGKLIHLLDAPGYPDFIGAALESLNAVETAVIVVSAVNGIEVNTRRMFSEAEKHGLARVLVVNKLDGDNIDFPALVENLQTSFGKKCVLFNAPVGVGANFKGVVSLLDPKAEEAAKAMGGEVPVDLATARAQLTEAVVDVDEALMEKYLGEGEVSPEELEAAIPRALAAGTVVPIFCTSAKKDKGVAELLEALCREAPSPAFSRSRLEAAVHAPGNGNGNGKAVEPSESGEFVGQVFKTVNDKFVGHLSFIRVLSGKMDTAHPLLNLRTGKSARVSQILMMQGKGHQTVPEAYPGDIVAVAKVDGLHIGDTVAFNAQAPKLPPPEFPRPMYGLAVEPKNRGDVEKISTSLHKIEEEDPTFRVTHDLQTHELVMTGISQLHLDVIQHRLKKRFDLEIITHEPKIPYRETITSEAAADYRHKKQTGGRGQFGEVHLRVYPLPREIKSQEQLEREFANKERFEKMRYAHYDPEFNFAFIDHIVGGTIPNQFMPAVEKGCRELLERGALAGYRLQDVAVEVHFGKYHDVDSSEAAFKTAGRNALKRAVLAAHPELLEPIVKLDVTVPSHYAGAVLKDMPSKRGQVENQDSLPGDLTVITARVPLAELSRYKAQLDSMTQGQGSFSMEFSHYDLVPANVKQQIVSKAKVHEEEED